MKITVDFNKTIGKIKPMHAVGQPPYNSPLDDNMEYLTRANIPYARLHDMGGDFGGGVYVDIPNLFRDFSADERLPASYDFAFTDNLLKRMAECGVMPVFRLGVTIENYQRLRVYRLNPPEDYEKWARICEHIIMHYNEGWANGFYMGIEYWEIWNEPDSDTKDVSNSEMWKGSAQDYFRLYEVASNHLKSRFGSSIKIGGYASCGFYAMDADADGKGLGHPAADRFESFIEFFHDFLRYITSPEHKAPLDFFSWHSYADVPTTLKMELYCRRVLDGYGLYGVEELLDEWNTTHDDGRSTPRAAANAYAMMLGMQKTRINMLNFYDARIRRSDYEGLFNSETRKPLPAYYAFMSFGRAYRLGNEAYSVCGEDGVYVCAATDGRRGSLMIANLNPRPFKAELDVSGMTLEEILVIDETYTYSPTGIEIKDGALTLSPFSCTEIRYYK